MWLEIITWKQRLALAHRVCSLESQIEPTDSHHRVFGTETNAAWMSTLLLCNTFNAWIPCENRSCWTYCIAFPIMWNWKACYSLYTDSFWIGFIYLYHKYPWSHGVSHASCWEWWEWKKLKSPQLSTHYIREGKKSKHPVKNVKSVYLYVLFLVNHLYSWSKI